MVSGNLLYKFVYALVAISLTLYSCSNNVEINKKNFEKFELTPFAEFTPYEELFKNVERFTYIEDKRRLLRENCAEITDSLELFIEVVIDSSVNASEEVIIFVEVSKIIKKEGPGDETEIDSPTNLTYAGRILKGLIVDSYYEPKSNYSIISIPNIGYAEGKFEVISGFFFKTDTSSKVINGIANFCRYNIEP